MDPNDKIVVYSNQPDKKKFFRDLYARNVVAGQPDSYSVTQNGAGGTLRGGRFGNTAGSVLRGTVTTTGSGLSAVNTFPGAVVHSGVAVNGTFKCTGARAASGGGTALCGYESFADLLRMTGTGWTFTPTDANASLYEPYLYFGWWMDVAPPDDRFEVFYKAVQAHAGDATTRPAVTPRGSGNTSGTALTGSATYEGAAGGRYAIRALGVENGSRSGDFVADVTLNVNFDADKYESSGATLDEKGVALSGAISNFRADHDGSNKWVVTLSADKEASVAGMQPLLNLYDTAEYKTEWRVTDGSVPIGEGQWKVDFYGGASNAAPESAAGVFMAGASNRSSLIGSFAATKETPGQ